jgi:hypothetical protein
MSGSSFAMMMGAYFGQEELAWIPGNFHKEE